MLEKYDDVLSVKEVQQILKVGRNRAYALIANGEIRSIRLGKIYKIPKAYLIDFLSA